MAKGGSSEAGLPPGGQGAIGGFPLVFGPGGTLLAVRSIGLCLTALPLILAFPGAALAQEAVAPPPTEAPPDPVIDFSADEVIYENSSDTVTALGQVRMSRDGNHLAADQVSWDRTSGRVVAKGNVVVVTPEGDKLVGEKVDLTDSLRDGTVENLLLVLESGGRVAAARGSRSGDLTQLENAVY